MVVKVENVGVVLGLVVVERMSRKDVQVEWEEKAQDLSVVWRWECCVEKGCPQWPRSVVLDLVGHLRSQCRVVGE